MNKILTGVVLAASLTGCFDELTCTPRRSSGDPLDAKLQYPWYPWQLPLLLNVDSSLDHCPIENLQKAVEFWTNVRGEDTFIVTESPYVDYATGANLYMRYDESYDYWATSPKAIGVTFNRYRLAKNGQNMLVGSNISLRSCSWVVIAHELGHALGLKHSERQYDIMYESEQTDSPIVTLGEMNLLEYSCDY